MRRTFSLFLAGALATCLLGGELVGRAEGDFRASNSTANVALASPQSDVFAKLGSDAIDNPTTGRVPNYLRAIAAIYPDSTQPFAHLFKTVLYGGTLPSETKAAMGYQIAVANGSPYATAHLTRILEATETGRNLLNAMQNRRTPAERERVALRYAVNLNKAVLGVSDSEFVQVRAQFNDAQIVEMTITVCFFNYFSRFAQGAGLPLETWAKEKPNALPAEASGKGYGARVTIASDAEMQMANKVLNPAPAPKGGSLGIGIANSQRAMLRVPDLADSWWGYWRALREKTKLPRTTQLHISFAVSMANGCRYCTLHQVAGLRRQGVDITKLLSMQKEDAMLSPKELSAVVFARKLTKAPGAMSAADYNALKTGLGDEQEALDALLQTCAFSFMNRFTDGLRLPSEEEAVKVYQEVYGDGSYKDYHTNRTRK